MTLDGKCTQSVFKVYSTYTENGLKMSLMP